MVKPCPGTGTLDEDKFARGRLWSSFEHVGFECLWGIRERCQKHNWVNGFPDWRRGLGWREMFVSHQCQGALDTVGVDEITQRVRKGEGVQPRLVGFQHLMAGERRSLQKRAEQTCQNHRENSSWKPRKASICWERRSSGENNAERIGEMKTQ